MEKFSFKDLSIMSTGAERKGVRYLWVGHLLRVCRIKVLQLKEGIGNEPDRNRLRIEI